MDDVPEIVKRVALAMVQDIRSQGEMADPLFENDEEGPFWQGKLDTTVDGSIDLASVARAAITAMREPPDSMCVPGGLAIEEAMFAENKLVFEGARDCFNAMLDAALSPVPPQP